MAVAEFTIAPEALKQLLHLPDDCEVWGESPAGVTVGVSHPDIPHTAGIVKPRFRREGDIIYFDGWGYDG